MYKEDNDGALEYDDDDDDKGEDEEDEEEEEFDDMILELSTPISQVNEFSFMKTIFNRLFNDNKAYYDKVIGELNKDQQNVLKAIFN